MTIKQFRESLERAYQAGWFARNDATNRSNHGADGSVLSRAWEDRDDQEKQGWLNQELKSLIDDLML